MDAPGGRKIRAAVYYPPGAGPFPIVVVLHGTDGFRPGYLPLAEEFAKGGFLTVTGCWFEGSHFIPPFSDVLPCPQGPTFKGANLESVRDVLALLTAVRTLPRAQAERVGLWGISRGATVSLLVASTGLNVQAVLSAAAIYTGPKRGIPDTLPITLVRDLQAPVLMLHGTADEIVPVQEARDYERTLRDLGKPFEVHYYEGGPHGAAIMGPTRDDALRRAIAFFTKHLLR